MAVPAGLGQEDLAFGEACWEGRTDDARLYKGDVNAEGVCVGFAGRRMTYTGLTGACLRGNTDTCRALVTEMGADVEKPNMPGGFAPLRQAVESRYPLTATALVRELGANPDGLSGPGGAPALRSAKTEPMVRLLICELRANPNTCNVNGDPPWWDADEERLAIFAKAGWDAGQEVDFNVELSDAVQMIDWRVEWLDSHTLRRAPMPESDSDSDSLDGLF